LQRRIASLLGQDGGELFDVHSRGTPGLFGIARQQRIKEDLMAFRQVAEARLASHERNRRSKLDAKRQPDVEEHLVPGSLNDPSVEPDVVLDLPVEISLPRGVTHSVQLQPKPVDAVIKILNRKTCRDLLERGAHRIDLHKVLP
jgi:hypothetical protein